MTTMLGGADCAKAEEIEAQTMRSEGRRNFFMKNKPFEQNTDCIGAVAATVLADANTAARISAP